MVQNSSQSSLEEFSGCAGDCLFGQTDTATGDKQAGRRPSSISAEISTALLSHVDYTRQTVKIEAVLDHREYDRGLWKRLF